MGVVGTGKLGRQHVRILKELDLVDEVVCYDVSAEKCRDVAQEFGAQASGDLEHLLAAVEAVSVVIPTVDHARVALKAIAEGKDVFIEKPLAATVAEGREVVERAERAGKIVQVGHVERFNPTLQSSLSMIESASFIEIERLSPPTLRGTDVSVVMDLMIHDLDILLLLTGRWPLEIRAKGARVFSAGPDIVNARLEYPDGCVANVTASRISLEPSRKIRIFSSRQYLSIDLLAGRVKHCTMREAFRDRVGEMRKSSGREKLDMDLLLSVNQYTFPKEEPLRHELTTFCRAVSERTPPPVSAREGLEALRLAAAIQERMDLESIP